MKTGKTGIIAALITIILPLLLSACGGDSNNNQSPQTCTVRFEANGGNPTPIARLVRQGETVSAPMPEPARLGFYFDGWYDDSALTPASRVTFPYTVTVSITLYAKWIPSGLTAISASGSYTVALKADGSLWTWGDNVFGQLGTGAVPSSYFPIPTGTDKDWLAISAGGSHTVALKNDGSLWAWGSNDSGQLGDGKDTDLTTPVQNLFLFYTQ